MHSPHHRAVLLLLTVGTILLGCSREAASQGEIDGSHPSGGGSLVAAVGPRPGDRAADLAALLELPPGDDETPFRSSPFRPEAARRDPVARLLAEGRPAEAHAAARELAERARRAGARGGSGPPLPELCDALHDLGLVEHFRGDPEATLALATEALTTCEAAWGTDDPRLDPYLDLSRRVATQVGRWRIATRHTERLIEVRTRSHGPESASVAVLHRFLGHMELHLGDLESSFRRLARAYRILATRFAPHHSQVAATASQLAETLTVMGHPGPAREILDRALQADRGDRELAANHRGRLLLRLGQVEEDLGRWREAEALFGRALDVLAESPRRRFLPAQALEGLARVRLAGGLASALEPARRALALRRESGGEGSSMVPPALALVARAHRRRGQVRQAFDTGLRAEHLARRHLALTTRTLGEPGALAYARVRADGLDVALELLGAVEGPETVRHAWDALVRSRALVLDEMASRHRGVLDAGDPGVAAVAAELTAARESLAFMALHAVGDGDDLEAAFARKDALEEELAWRSLPFRRELDARRAGLREVAAALPPGAALAAWVRFDLDSGAHPGASARYGAFVLPAAGAEPSWVQLGEADEIERRIAAWRNLLRPPRGLAASTETWERRARTAGDAVRRAVWDPVAERLAQTGAPDGERRMVFVVPDGALHRVHLGALPAPEGGYLIEHSAPFHYLSAERDLTTYRSPEPGTRGSADLLAVGGPAFGRAKSATPAGLSRVLACLGGPDAGPGRGFAPLPRAAAEGRLLAERWREAGLGAATRLTGDDATEAAVKRLAAENEVLHFATHAFVLPRDCLGAAGGVPGPLVRSGLALAGANRPAVASGQDGILTAEEVASLDLRRARWVVLSACETGLGDLQDGEGVLGLQRAFRVAGARTLVMSLWRVGDEEARRFMDVLYTSRLAGAPSLQAVRQASLAVLRERRAEGRSTHPYHWGAFISAGDWR